MAQTKVKAIPIQIIDTATLNNVFQPFTVGAIFPEACFMLTVQNDSNTSVMISLDGINGAFVVRANSDYTLMTQTNAQPASHLALIAKGTLPMILGNAGAGSIYLSAYYV